MGKKFAGKANVKTKKKPEKGSIILAAGVIVCILGLIAAIWWSVGAVALANIFCWAAALLYAQMASKSVTFSMPFFINAVHSQASLSACLISGCFVFNYQNLCPF